jgi:hypothetical protein
MIVVTKPGKLPEERKYGGRCENCGCEVTCLKADLTTACGIECPTKGCSAHIHVQIMVQLDPPDAYRKLLHPHVTFGS